MSAAAVDRLGSSRTAREGAIVLPTIDVQGYRMGRNLVLATLWLLATVRAFTEVVPVLPRALNFIDVPLLLALAVHATVGVPVRGKELRHPPFVAPTLLFVGVWAVSAYANVGRVAPGPAFLFLYGFLGPLVFGLLVYRVWPVGQARALSSNLVALAVVQFLVVLFVDVPIFVRIGDPDIFSGTYGDNAYQLVFFLIVFGALLAGIATFEPKRTAARFALPLLGGAFLVIFMAQYRALLITTGLAVLATGFLIGSRRRRGIVVGVVSLAALFFAFSFVAGRFPISKLAPTVAAIRTEPGLFMSAGKVGATEDIGRLYADDPRYALTGTGPGTYSSRAWRTFALLGFGSQTDVAGSYVSAVTGGSRYRTDVSEKYVLPRWYRPDVILGSAALGLPFSSYLALLAEVGVLGFLVIVGVYVAGLARLTRMTRAVTRDPRPGDPLPALLIATAVAFFVLLQMAFLENWLEVARVTIPTWVMFAISVKEFQARRAAGADAA